MISEVQLITMMTFIKVRPRGSKACPHHVDREVMYVCEDCPPGTLACPDCVTSCHRTHRLEKLANTIPWKKEQILRHIDTTESQTLPFIQHDIAVLDRKLLENTTTFQNLAESMKNHGNLWKTGIENYIGRNLQLFVQLEKDNAELLLKHKSKLLSQSSDIKDMLESYHDILKSENNVEIFDIKPELHVHSIKPHVKTAKFKQQKFSSECLPGVFGTVEIKHLPPCQTTVGKKSSTVPVKQGGSQIFLKPQGNPKLLRRNSTGQVKETRAVKLSEQRTYFSKLETNSKCVHRNSIIVEATVKPIKKSDVKPPSKNNSHIWRQYSTTNGLGNNKCKFNNTEDSKAKNSKTSGQGYMLASPTQLVKFDTAMVSIDFICPTTEDQAWACRHNDTVVLLLDLMGDTQEQVVCPSGITGVSAAPDTGHLWLSSVDCGIREVVLHQPKAVPKGSNSKSTTVSTTSSRFTPNKNKILQRQKSMDCSRLTMSENSSKKTLHRKNSLDSRIPPKPTTIQNDFKMNYIKRRMSLMISKSVQEPEFRSTDEVKSVESKSKGLPTDEHLHSNDQPLVLPRINITPPDSNSVVMCIFNDGEEFAQDLPPETSERIHVIQNSTQCHPDNSSEVTTCCLEVTESCSGKQLEKYQREGTTARKKLVVRFYVDNIPWSIGVAANNSILVGMANIIVMYTTWGQVIRKVCRDGWFSDITPSITSLQQLVECPITRNVAVLAPGNGETQHVFIMDSTLNLKFYYAGKKDDTSDETSAISTSSFSASALCYDNGGNLVVADGNNKSIVLVSGTGQYIRTLHQDTWTPQALGVQTDNTLWASFRLYSLVEVKLIKYTD